MDFSVLTAFIDSLPARGISSGDCAVWQDHKQIYRHGAGWFDIKTKTPVREDALYNLYSTSKVITCAAAMQLFEKGKFLMTDPLSDYLPEFKNMKVRASVPGGGYELRPATRQIKIVDLFTMSAGLTYDVNTPAIRALREATGGNFSTRQFIGAVAEGPLAFEPGEHWNYSLCHDVLGALIEVLSGMTFGEYLRKNIFEPAGMADTGFALPESKAGRLASQYRFNDATKTPDEIPKTENSYRASPSYESGGAGLISSVADYARFTDALACGGVAATGAKLLSRAAIDLMRTNQLDETRMREYNWIQMSGYGYGLGVRTVINRAAGGVLSPVGEFGWGGAAGAYVLIDPENKLSVFYAQHMLNNQEPYVHPRLRNIIYAALN